VGVLTGGSAARLGSLRLAWAPLIVLGMVVQLLLFSSPVGNTLGDLAPAAYVDVERGRPRRRGRQPGDPGAAARPCRRRVQPRELIGAPDDDDDGEGWAFARAIIALGRSLGLPIVAEGIETPEQLRVLRQLGCGMGQGFLFGRPASAGVLGPRLINAAAADQASELASA
jgi:hypothetical protein